MPKKKLDIIYEDKKLLIVNKPSKYLTIATDKQQWNNLYQEVSDYVKKQHPKNKIFIVNRLDRDTSGIVVFAKEEKLKKELQENWNELANPREYLAIVEGKVSKDKGTIKTYLKEDKNLLITSTDNAKNGKLAITNYQVIAKTSTYTLLKITILTGRKHQIRVQLKEIGHPIIGDKRYGAKKNPLSRLGLHATYLELQIPHTKTKLKFNAKIPKEFKNIFPKEIGIYEKNINI